METSYKWTNHVTNEVYSYSVSESFIGSDVFFMKIVKLELIFM
jgi:hypothetical protein